MPYVMAFVLVLAFVLLLVTFRSLIVPVKAIVLNLLSVSAAYGVLELVFQHHRAESLLGFHSNGTIISWPPLFLSSSSSGCRWTTTSSSSAGSARASTAA
jgi:uncharacterized membrane protein YdfJ with MMPL/SSD domain